MTNVTLDGYIEDERGAYDVGPVDAEVFRSHTNLPWETNATLAAQSELMADFATAWQTANKVVYSTTLAAASTANTPIERHFDPPQCAN